MDRQGIIGILLAVLGLVSWQIYYTKKRTARSRHSDGGRDCGEERAARCRSRGSCKCSRCRTVAAAVDPANPAVTPASTPALETAPAQLEKLSTPTAEYTFTNLGGGIQRALLLQHAAENKSKIVLNEFGSIPIGAVTEIAGEGTSVPLPPPSITQRAR
jgi:hypothetical protein